MREPLVMTRPDHRQVVGTLRGMREEVRNVQARLPVFLERSPGCEKYGLPELCILKIGIAKAFRWMLAVQLPQQRLRIEGIHVAGAALHEQRDDALRRC